MLAKGHDLPHLTLVVVVGVDEGLHSVDFRAGERLGQLVVQVAGRAGRAERPGTVILQTHDPEHPLLAVLLNGGYRALSTQASRRTHARASLPPFAHFALLRAEAKAVGAARRVPRRRRRGDRRCRDCCARSDARADAAPRGRAARADADRSGRARDDAGISRAHGSNDCARLPEGKALRWSIDVDPVDLY